MFEVVSSYASLLQSARQGRFCLVISILMHDNVKLTICNKSRGTSIHHKFAITVFYCNIIKWKACAFSTMEPKFSQCGNFILLQPENHILYDNSEIIQYNSLETMIYTITWKRMTLQPGIYLIFYFENQWIYNIEPCELATWKPYNFTYKKCYTKERSYDCYNQKLFESTTWKPIHLTYKPIDILAT